MYPYPTFPILKQRGYYLFQKQVRAILAVFSLDNLICSAILTIFSHFWVGPLTEERMVAGTAETLRNELDQSEEPTGQLFMRTRRTNIKLQSSQDHMVRKALW